MTRFLIYLFPALMDLVLGAVFFISATQIVDTGAKPIMSTLVLAIWAVFYMVFAQVAGTIVTPKNAAKIIIGACLLIGFTAIAYIVLPFSILAHYILIAFIAVGAAFFFAPFQVFMKTVESDRPQGIALSTGLYTFSWSVGMASGPFVAGIIKTSLENWNLCHVINAFVAFFAAAGIYFLKHHAHKEPSQTVVEEHHEFIDYSKFPDFALLSWIASGVGCLTVAIVRIYFPTTGKLFQMPEFNQGVVLALVSGTQGVVGLCLCKSKYWMYKPVPVMLFGISGVAGLVLFAFGGSAMTFYLASILYGIYSGAFFFYLVFHALVHPEKSSRYVAVNESVVGGTSILGALLAGYLAEEVSLSYPYVLCAQLAALVIFYQIMTHAVKLPSRLFGAGKRQSVF